MNNAVYGTFIPLYFQHIGFTPAQIGTLLSLGPFVAILAQPVWGMISDRAKTKNSVLLPLLAVSGVSMLLYPLSAAFGYVLAMIGLFMFFQSSIAAVGDAVTLEALDMRKSIRLGGTVGFASEAFGMQNVFFWNHWSLSFASSHLPFSFRLSCGTNAVLRTTKTGRFGVERTCICEAWRF